MSLVGVYVVQLLGSQGGKKENTRAGRFQGQRGKSDRAQVVK